jgi:hypothetical protein
MTTEVHAALAHLFGLDRRPIYGFELRCFVGETVRLVVHEHLIDKKRLRIGETRHRFKLTLEDPPPDSAYAAMRRVVDGIEAAQPFDLDRACEQAMRRVLDGIERDARRALATLGLH